MEDNARLFVMAQEWKNEHWSPNVKCIIWGTGQVAGEVRETLRLLEVPVYAYGDNDAAKQGTLHEGKIVLSAEDLQGLDSFCVLLGSYVVRPVYEQLKSLGVRDIFVLLDALKYPAEELLQDRKFLASYFSVEGQGQAADRTLVEVYGDIGDVLIKIGLLHGLRQLLGEDRLWVLVEEYDIGEVLQEIFPQVIVAPRQRLVQDRAFRLEFLKSLNERHFSRSLVLCDARLHANRRVLNRYNFNVPKVDFARRLPDREYLPELDREFLLDIFPELENEASSPLHLLDDACDRFFPQVFPYEKKNYAVVNLGAKKEVRHYEAEKFRDVVVFLLSKEMPVVLLGRGDYDLSWASELKRDFPKGFVLDCVGKYSLMESVSVIRYARLFVGTDSGMWNASYVTGTPSVVLYGLGEYGCFMHKEDFVHYAMTDDISCLGCRWYCTHRAASGRVMCLDDISPSKIIGKIREVLDEK